MTLDERVSALEAGIAALRAQLAAIAAGRVQKPADVGPIDLDDPRNDWVVRFDPKRWQGPSCSGLALSACPPEFLLLLAESLEYFASNPKPGKESWAANDAKRAATCRAWAERLTSAPKAEPIDVEELPF